MPHPSTPRRPVILTLRVASGEPEAHTFPNFMYSQDAAERAIRRIGRDGYTVLRTKAFQGVTAQLAALDSIMAPLEEAVARTEAMGPDADGGNEARRAVEILGQETHWHAIHRVGQAVESLCAVASALEAYRDGASTSDVSRLLVRHDLDLQRVMQSKRARTLAYWEKMGGRPIPQDLADAGLGLAQAKELLAANRTWAGKMLRMFQEIVGFYSSPFHQVYVKYRHGYTLVSPGVSPLYVLLDRRTRTDVEAAVGNGFVVMHESFDGHRVIHVVKSGTAEIRTCLEMARLVLTVTRSLATAWLIQVEHPEHRTIAFDTAHRRLVVEWIGSGLDDVYQITRMFDPRS